MNKNGTVSNELSITSFLDVHDHFLGIMLKRQSSYVESSKDSSQLSPTPNRETSQFEYLYNIYQSEVERYVHELNSKDPPTFSYQITDTLLQRGKTTKINKFSFLYI